MAILESESAQSIQGVKIQPFALTRSALQDTAKCRQTSLLRRCKLAVHPFIGTSHPLLFTTNCSSVSLNNRNTSSPSNLTCYSLKRHLMAASLCLFIHGFTPSLSELPLAVLQSQPRWLCTTVISESQTQLQTVDGVHSAPTHCNGFLHAVHKRCLRLITEHPSRLLNIVIPLRGGIVHARDGKG